VIESFKLFKANGLVESEAAKVGAVRLEEDLFQSFGRREIVKKVVEELKVDGEKPEEFFVDFEDKNTSLTIVHLWHESAFEEHNLNVVGNPSGKCRDFYYDFNKRQIVRKAFWQ